MRSKKAADILINLLKKRSLGLDEKEAILTAIGVLSWAALGESKIKTLSAKKNKRDGENSLDNASQ